MMTEITEQTKISLFAVIIAVPTIIGAAAWATSIFDKVQGLEARLSKYESAIFDIQDRVIRIEEQLKRRK